MPDSIDAWIQHEVLPFSVESDAQFHAAADKIIAALGASVELLGFGEALHGGEEILILRNRLFQRLVEVHGCRSIAVESSFPQSKAVDDYIAGRGPAAYEEVQDTGFSHGFGKLEANKELVEWMRRYNADPAHAVKLRFYGFDMPAGAGGATGPRQVLTFVLDYLAATDFPKAEEHHILIDSLLGLDADWEDYRQWDKVGLSPNATALRIATEDLITELQTHRPQLVERTGADRYLEALQHATVARQLLNFFAAMARQDSKWRDSLGQEGEPPAGPLAVRDVLMAEVLESILLREKGRGKVFAFAHNAHLQRSMAVWPGVGQKFGWWPAGSHLQESLGPRYAIMGSAVGVSADNGIGEPEEGSLEARLTAVPGPVRFLLTHRGTNLPQAEIDELPVRTGSRKNPTYMPLRPLSFADFDVLAVLDSTVYNRGGRPLPG